MKSFKEYIKFHPHKDTQGNPVRIMNPHEQTPDEHWNDPTKHATIVPGGNIAKELNGIPFSHWKAPKSVSEWNQVEGQGQFEEPHLHRPPGKRISTGVIIHEPDGRIWTVSPTNQFGGYKNIIGPKGHLDPGLSMRANAIKEAHEETGLKVELFGHAYDSNRSTSMTRFYHGRRVGGHPGHMGWESQAVHLVPKEHLASHLDSKYDKEIHGSIFKRD